MGAADLERLVAEVRAAVDAGRAPEAFRLAFQAVEVAEREQSSADAVLALAAESRWTEAIAQLDVFPSERDRFGVLAALLLLALTEEQPDSAAAETVLCTIALLPTGGYDPLEDYDPSLVLWLTGRACELGLPRPQRLLAARDQWSGREVVGALIRQITGERPEWLLGPWETARPTPLRLSELSGATERLDLAVVLTEEIDPAQKNGRGERGRCFADVGRVFAALGKQDRAAELLARALAETAQLDTEEFCDDTFDRQPCVTAIARACAALGSESALELLGHARREADRIDHEGWKGWAFKSLALATAQLGQPEAARSLLEEARSVGWEVNPGHWQAEVLVAVALAWAQQDAAKAKEVLKEAWAGATERYDPKWRREWDRLKAMLCVGAGWGILGERVRGSECLAAVHSEVHTLEDGYHRGMALRALAEVQHDLGSTEQAGELLREAWESVRSTDKDSLLPDGCAVLARDLARLGEEELALQALELGLEPAFASASERDYGRPLQALLEACRALPTLASTALLTGLLERAQALAERRTRSRVVSGIAAAFARLGALHHGMDVGTRPYARGSAREAPLRGRA